MRPPSSTELETKGVGLALSGGGYRSALLGLGALYYLAESEKIAHLRTITSVSGGSYTNAQALLCTNNLRAVDGSNFVAAFKPFVVNMTAGSPWTRPRLVAWLALLFATLAIALLGRGLHLLIRIASFIGFLLLVPVAGRSLALSVWRTLFPDYARELALGKPITDGRVRPARSKLTAAAKVVQPRLPDEAEAERTHHIFCTTDLHYTRFTYLTNHVVYNRALGIGSPSEFTVGDAVDASAAIPPIFAPVALDTSGFLKPPPDSPRRLLSVDGGIYDTLATEWFTATEQQERRLASRLKILDHRLPDDAGLIVVVDGSKPPLARDYVKWTTVPLLKRSRIPVMWWIAGHFRSAQLAFSNWDRRNLESIASNSDDQMAAFSINQVPFSLDLSDAKQKALRQNRLNWHALVRRNGRVPTWPKKLSHERACALLYHGYAMAWATLENDDCPRDMPSLEAFKSHWSS